MTETLKTLKDLEPLTNCPIECTDKHHKDVSVKVLRLEAQKHIEELKERGIGDYKGAIAWIEMFFNLNDKGEK